MDGLVEEVGGWGRFQLLMVGTMKYGVMPIAWSMMQMAFAGLVPDWWCLPPRSYHNSTSTGGQGIRGNWSRDNITFQKCEIQGSDGQSCAAHVMFDASVSTVVSQWSLVCDLEYVKGMMTSVQMGGVLLGAFLSGYLTDTFGRRIPLYVTSLCHVVMSLVAAFSVRWQMFVVMRMLIGVTIGVYDVSYFSYPLEFVSPKYRQFVAFVPGWNMGVAIFALVAWQFPDWSYLHVGSALLGVPFILTWFVIPESARWLATKGRLREAEHVLSRMANINGRSLPSDTLQRLQVVANEEKEARAGRRYTYIDVYRGWTLAFTSLVLQAAWFSLSFCYYGISFGVGALSGNVYLNIFLMTVVEIPSNMSTIFLANKLGRRWTCFIFFLLGSAASFGILIVNQTASEDIKGTVTTVLAMISKLAVAAAWLAINTVTSELYPTVIRNMGYGASNTVSRVGGALAPILLNMDTEKDVVRGYIVVGSLMAVSGLASLILRETMGQGLQDSLTVGKMKDAAKDKANTSPEGDGDVHQNTMKGPQDGSRRKQPTPIDN